MAEVAPTPAALPPHVLERADVRSAIANHDFGEVFRLAKIHGHISYAKGPSPVKVGTRLLITRRA
jgi:hypothetical protein